MPLKVYVDTGENVWSTNSLEFDSYEKAKEYGNDLYSRWTLVRGFAVIPVALGFMGYLTIEIIKKIEIRE